MPGRHQTAADIISLGMGKGTNLEQRKWCNPDKLVRERLVSTFHTLLAFLPLSKASLKCNWASGGRAYRVGFLGLAGDESLYHMKINSYSFPRECSNIPGHSHLPVLNIKETARLHINHS